MECICLFEGWVDGMECTCLFEGWVDGMECPRRIADVSCDCHAHGRELERSKLGVSNPGDDANVVVRPRGDLSEYKRL
jgi:hypothetical protein